MTEKTNLETIIEAHSEEVQDIMSFIPNHVIRWGLTVIFILFAMLVVGSYYFKSPEIIRAPMILTTKNPPVSLISKSTGKIDRLFCIGWPEYRREREYCLDQQSNGIFTLSFT